ncbi:MAG: zinc ribbon domain-containing protein [Candidatus Methanomethylophilaceae archaeon]|nr:zinc ribbon domain-containing protein [Candidatus Methanomethylophilaceae archaeon]
MPWTCSECGRMEYGDIEFCTRCGALKADGYEYPVCERCGSVLAKGAPYCDNCARTVAVYNSAEDKRYFIALILAVVPGMFNILGLGHIFLGRWVRGLALALSGMALLYLTGVYMDNSEYQKWLAVASVVIYTVQFLDLLISRSLRQKV